MPRIEGRSVKEDVRIAFMKLMSKKYYMDITVTDVVKCAGVARASFYRNYSSTAEVLDSIVDRIVENIADAVSVLYDNDERKWREYLFEHFYRFAKINHSISDIEIRNRAVIFSIIDRKIRPFDSDAGKDGIRNKYIVGAKIGLINSVTKRWIETGMKETPEEMVDFIMSFIRF